MTGPPFERRRAEDVFKALEENVFPRITSLEQGLGKLVTEGCAHRPSDLRRTEEVETSVKRIFDKIDNFGEDLTEHRVAVTSQFGALETSVTGKFGALQTSVESKVNGVRIWVLGGCVVVLIALLSFFAVDYANDIGRIAGKASSAITK